VGITNLSDLDPDRPRGAVLYSEKLLGLRSECPACGDWESSTGWLFKGAGGGSRWYIELKCAGCRSRGGTWKREWLHLIEGVLTVMTKPCAACGGDGRCNACSGTGVDVGAAVMGGSEVDCERCGGVGACPVCGGSGEVIEDAAEG
jgi:hypothetical protein